MKKFWLYLNDHFPEIVVTVIIMFAVATLILALDKGYQKSKEIDMELYRKGYIDACRDFASNKLKAELKEFPSGERVWQWKGDKNE